MGDVVAAQLKLVHSALSGRTDLLACYVVGGFDRPVIAPVDDRHSQRPYARHADRRPLRGAAAFFLAPGALWLAWALFWIGLRCGPSCEDRTASAVVQGVGAAVLSGVMCYAISGMWPELTPATRTSSARSFSDGHVRIRFRPPLFCGGLRGVQGF
jgi:hypothetical protein